MKKNPVQIAKLLTVKNKQVNPVISEAKRLTEIKIVVSQSLDQQIADHLEVASSRNGQLTLLVNSPVWATRIRYMQEEIIERLKRYPLTKSIHNILIKVRPVSAPQEHKKCKKSPISISQESARQMIDEIDTISDPNLKSALLRITKHAK